MKKFYSDELLRIGSARRPRKAVASVCAALIICISTALMIPAGALEGVSCGREEHVHSTEAGCYTERKELICALPVHGNGHVHADECYEVTSSVICGLEETAGHAHTDECYSSVQLLVCTQTDPAHTHTEGCYSENRELTCALPEQEAHTHGAECMSEEKTLVCAIPGQAEEHFHTAECYSTVPVLICRKPEHRHNEACRASETKEDSAGTDTAKAPDPEKVFDWAKAEAEVKLTGDWNKDILTFARSQIGYGESTVNYIVDGSGEAKGYTRYGAWYGDPYGHWCAMYVAFCIDRIGIPRSLFPIDSNCQNWIRRLRSIGAYRESDIKTIITERETEKKPSVSELELLEPGHDFEQPLTEAPLPGRLFSLNDEITPLEYEAERLWNITKRHYIPAPGDLIFFDRTGDGLANHIGIVQEFEKQPIDLSAGTDNENAPVPEWGMVIKDEETNEYYEVTRIITVEGNTSEMVKNCAYSPLDPEIIGYGILPENPNKEVLNAGLEDGGFVKLKTYGGYLPDAASALTLSVEEKSDEQAIEFINGSLGGGRSDAPERDIVLFDISLHSTMQEVQPGGPVTLSFEGLDIPAEADRKYLKAFYTDPEKGIFEELEVTEENSVFSIETDHFSLYGFTWEKKETLPSQPAAEAAAPEPERPDPARVRAVLDRQEARLEIRPPSVRTSPAPAPLVLMAEASAIEPSKVALAIGGPLFIIVFVTIMLISRRNRRRAYVNKTVSEYKKLTLELLRKRSKPSP